MRETNGQACGCVRLPWEALVLPCLNMSHLDGILNVATRAPLRPRLVLPAGSPERPLTEPSFHQVSHLGLKLGDHLQHPGPRLFPAAPLLMEPFKTEMKKSETPEVPLTWEEETAGVEDVRSQTYSKDRLDRPRPAQPRGRGFGELQAWVPGPSQEDAGLEARARGHPSEGLWLAARPSQEEEGYIVTGNE